MTHLYSISAMNKIHLLYATCDGHTRRIADRLALKLKEHGVEVCIHDLNSLPNKKNHPPLLSGEAHRAKTDAGGSKCPGSNPGDFGEGFIIGTNDTVAVIAPIRYGWHLPVATRFLKSYKKSGVKNPLAVISVNLTARKPGKDTARGNPYLRRWLKRLRLKPALALAIAGNLDYPRYNLFDRLMIQLIMTITRGPTDPRVSVDFTPWDKVDALAAHIAALKYSATP